MGSRRWKRRDVLTPSLKDSDTPRKASSRVLSAQKGRRRTFGLLADQLPSSRTAAPEDAGGRSEDGQRTAGCEPSGTKTEGGADGNQSRDRPPAGLRAGGGGPARGSVGARR